MIEFCCMGRETDHKDTNDVHKGAQYWVVRLDMKRSRRLSAEQGREGAA